MAVKASRWMTLAGLAACGHGFAQKGVVIDEGTGKPIAKAVVMQKPSWAMALTDEKGEFEFPTTDRARPVPAPRAQRLRLFPDGTLRLPPSASPSGPSRPRLFTPQGQSFPLAFAPDGAARLPSRLPAGQILFLRAGGSTYRLVRLGGEGFFLGEASGRAHPSAAAKSSAAPETLIISRYGYDAEIRLVNGSDQGAIKLRPNPKAPPPGMVELKGATYLMGSRRDPVASPEHAVTVGGFYMDTVEVTQADFRLMMGGEALGRNHGGYDLNFGPQYAALNMTWYEAVLYCNQRSKRDGLDTAFSYTGKTPVPSEGTFNLDNLKIDIQAKGYRLATEAEWEYGCKAGQDSDYFWGTNRGLHDSAMAYAWYANNSDIFGGTLTNCPVARKRKNRFGIYDIVGNASEYVLDSRISPYPAAPTVNPFFESGEKPPSRTDRGGGWTLPINGLTCTARGSIFANTYSPVSGIRVVLPIR